MGKNNVKSIEQTKLKCNQPLLIPFGWVCTTYQIYKSTLRDQSGEYNTLNASNAQLGIANAPILSRICLHMIACDYSCYGIAHGQCWGQRVCLNTPKQSRMLISPRERPTDSMGVTLSCFFPFSLVSSPFSSLYLLLIGDTMWIVETGTSSCISCTVSSKKVKTAWFSANNDRIHGRRRAVLVISSMYYVCSMRVWPTYSLHHAPISSQLSTAVPMCQSDLYFFHLSDLGAFIPLRARLIVMFDLRIPVEPCHC